jgi:hypothetical protein
MDLRETGWDSMGWIHMAQDMAQWRTLVNTIMNVLAAQSTGNILTNSVTLNISRSTLLRGDRVSICFEMNYHTTLYVPTPIVSIPTQTFAHSPCWCYSWEYIRSWVTSSCMISQNNTVLIRTLEVPGSNQYSQNVYLDWHYRGLPQCQLNMRTVPHHTTSSFRILFN